MSPARDISDGTQDALIVRITTDDGLVGIGEVDSSPEVVKAAIEAPKSHLTSCGLRELLIGEDPRDVGRLWEKCYRGSSTSGAAASASTRSAGSTSPSGTSRGRPPASRCGASSAAPTATACARTRRP